MEVRGMERWDQSLEMFAVMMIPPKNFHTVATLHLCLGQTTTTSGELLTRRGGGEGEWARGGEEERKEMLTGMGDGVNCQKDTFDNVSDLTANNVWWRTPE